MKLLTIYAHKKKYFFTAHISHEIKGTNPFSNLNCYNASCSSKSYLPVLQIRTYKMNLSRVIKKAELHLLWGSCQHFFILLFIRRKYSFIHLQNPKYHYLKKKKKNDSDAEHTLREQS